MAIKVGREERQVSEGGALLMGQAPDTRAIERAQVEQAGVIGRLGEQVAFAAGKVSEVLERERQEKNTIAAGDAFNNIFAEAGQAVNEITVNATGSAAEGQTDKFRNETLPAITQKYTEGLSPDAAQELTEKMQRQQLIWQSALSSHETKQLRVAKINKDDTTLRNFTSEILNTTSNDPARGKAMLELRIADMKQEIDETGYGPEAAAQANAVAAQDLLISYYMGLDPEQALVELEQGFGNELFVSAQDQQELEKRLTIKKSQAENLAEKERRKRADSDMVDLLKLANDDKPIDLESIMNNPHFKANDIKAAQNILNWQTTRISEGVKNKQYNDTMQFIYTHPNPAAISNSDIISMLGDAKDAEHFITKRDQM
ncbi:MAG: hypothetical protein KAR06_04685, partial [Deltaproteobacteria bacterium]|nr:hypothetical protein [Deltaproteobacteria bacterium]